jgi:hypothetical protein
MPVCAFETAATGVSGGLVLAKSGTQNNSTACDYVLLTSAEYDQIYHAVLVSPTGSGKGSGSLLDMTPEQAVPVTAAVFGVWAVAWAAKQAIRTLRGSDEKID